MLFDYIIPVACLLIGVLAYVWAGSLKEYQAERKYNIIFVAAFFLEAPFARIMRLSVGGWLGLAITILVFGAAGLYLAFDEYKVTTIEDAGIKMRFFLLRSGQALWRLSVPGYVLSTLYVGSPGIAVIAKKNSARNARFQFVFAAVIFALFWGWLFYYVWK